MLLRQEQREEEAAANAATEAHEEAEGTGLAVRGGVGMGRVRGQHQLWSQEVEGLHG